MTEDHQARRCLRDFLLTLFRLLDEFGVRYCVLHSWEKLPDELPNDLDLAILNEDKSKLLPVFDGLRAKGYFPIQALNHSVNGNFFAFFWTEASGAKMAAVDIVSEHRRGGMSLASDVEMVTSRQRRGAFWTASSQVEFAYLLAKKAFKRKASDNQLRRLKFLATQLGPAEADRLAATFLSRDASKQAVQSCIDGSTPEFLKDGREKLWRTSLTRRPWKLIPYLGTETWRLVRRWFQPTGITVAIIGPDGVGKSTIIAGLVETLDIAFWRRHRLFHWRPSVIAPRPDRGPVPDPHGEPVRGPLASMMYLSGFFLDYYAGYLLVIRRLLAKSNFIIFDRYFHDVLVDPQRYRYGGPKWFAEILSRLVPQPDLVILLDVDPETILGRKSELPREEIERQRKAYHTLQFRDAKVAFLHTNISVHESVSEAAAAVAECMTRRFDERFCGWLSSAAAQTRDSEVYS
jgi:thymidylate kinase